MAKHDEWLREHFKELAAGLKPIHDHFIVLYPSTIHELVHALSPKLNVLAVDSLGNDLHYGFSSQNKNEPIHSFYSLLFTNGSTQQVGDFNVCGEHLEDSHGIEVCIRNLLEHYRRGGMTTLYEHQAGVDEKKPWIRLYTHNVIEYPKTKDALGICMGQHTYTPFRPSSC